MPLEKDIQELTGAVRALNDTIFELRQALAGGAVTPTPEDKPKTKKAPKKKPAPEPVTEQPDKSAVIEALKVLQQASDPDTVRALLKQFEAPTVAKLDPSKYQDVINAAQEAAA